MPRQPGLRLPRAVPATGAAMEVPVSADSASKGGLASPRSAGLQRQSAGSSTGSGRRIDRRSAESGVGGASSPPQERVSLTLQRISVQAPGAKQSTGQ